MFIVIIYYKSLFPVVPYSFNSYSHFNHLSIKAITHNINKSI